MNYEVIREGKTLPEAYHNALLGLGMVGRVTECADWNQKQKEVSMTMVVDEPLAEPMISRLFIGGPGELQHYIMEMLDGILDFEVERGKWTYTYHQRMVEPVDQVQFVIDELKRNPSSRRAVIMIRSAQDIGSDDPACLQHIQYFIREGKLECKVVFRSNDACKATFMNAFALIMLQKRIADALGVEVGTYTHRANSFHCYERDYDLLRGYMTRIVNSHFEDITYVYDGDPEEEFCWKPMMEEEIERIEREVKELWAR